MEGDRPWTPESDGLDVVVQKTWTLRRVWKHERFRQGYELHVPYDTILQLHRFRPDAILSAELGSRTVQAVAFARMARVPVVIWATLTEHLEQSRGRLRELLRRRLVPMVDRVIVNGASGASYIRFLGGKDGRIVTVPQAIELGPLLAIPLERDPSASRRLLFVGAVSELKGVGLLLQAAAAWAGRHPDESLALTVVGDGPLRADIQRMSLPPQPRGRVGRSRRVSRASGVGAARCGCSCSLQGDEWGLVVNEALAAGLPVVGSVYSQAVSELIVDGSNGWRFQADGADAIEGALERALRTPQASLEEMLGRRARASVEHLAPGAHGGTAPRRGDGRPLSNITLRTEIVRGGAYLGIRQVVGTAINVAGVILLPRFLGPSDYGVYAAAMGLFVAVQLVAQLGVGVYLVRAADADRPELFWCASTLLLAAGCAAAVTASLRTPLAQRWTRIDGLVGVGLVVFAMLPLSNLTQVPLARLERALDYRRVAWVELVSQLLFFVVAIPLAWMGAGPWAPVAGFAAQQVVAFALTHVGGLVPAALPLGRRRRADRRVRRGVHHLALDLSAAAAS